MCCTCQPPTRSLGKPSPITVSSKSLAAADAIRRTGIQDFHWHDLRHTFASRIVMATGDLRTVQDLLGHKDIRMTMRYAHLTKNHRATAVETIVPTKAEKARRSGFRVVGGKKTGAGA
jgi:site-specific recombinase XerC